MLVGSSAVRVWHADCYIPDRAATKKSENLKGEIPMAIQKKSLIGNLTAAKKAIIATNVASTPFATPSRVETAKNTAHVAVAKYAPKNTAHVAVAKYAPKNTAHVAVAKHVAKPVAKAFAKAAAKTAAKTTAKNIF